MSKVQINRLTNANVYLDGGSLLGQAAEVKLPQLKTKMSDHAALGMVGTVELPTGIDKLSASIKWTSFYGDTMKAEFNPFKAVNLQLRASLEIYDSTGRAQELSVVCFLTGTFKDPEMGTFKQHDNVERSTEMNVTYVKLEIDGNPIVEFDALANIYKVAGDDILTTYRLNLGA